MRMQNWILSSPASGHSASGSEGGENRHVAFAVPVSAREESSTGVCFHLRPPVLEDLKLPGQESRTVRLLSLPLHLAGQLDRLLAEAFGPGSMRD